MTGSDTNQKPIIPHLPIVGTLNPLERTIVIADDREDVIQVLTDSIEGHFGKIYKLNIEQYRTGHELHDRLLLCRSSHLTYFIDALISDGGMETRARYDGLALLKLAEQIFRVEAKCRGNSLFLFSGELDIYKDKVSDEVKKFEKTQINDLLSSLDNALKTSRQEYVQPRESDPSI